MTNIAKMIGIWKRIEGNKPTDEEIRQSQRDYKKARHAKKMKSRNLQIRDVIKRTLRKHKLPVSCSVLAANAHTSTQKVGIEAMKIGASRIVDRQGHVCYSFPHSSK